MRRRTSAARTARAANVHSRQSASYRSTWVSTAGTRRRALKRVWRIAISATRFRTPMDVDPSQLKGRKAYGLVISALVPRPIAFVSTLGPSGVANCAPFSFFMGVSTNPPVIAISVSTRKGERKDTSRNILDTKEFVVNVVTEAIAERMNVASADYAPEVSEFDEAGLTAVPSARVKPPRIAESPVHFECRLLQVIEVGRSPNSLILGEVVHIHVADDVLADGLVDVHRLRPVGRLGGSQYCRVRDVFEMSRPDVKGAKSTTPTPIR